MRQIAFALAFCLVPATGALAQESGAVPLAKTSATQLHTVTTGECDGRSAVLEVTRGDSIGSGEVATILDGRRIQLEPAPIARRILEDLGPMDVTITCSSTEVVFDIEIHPAEVGGDERRILSRLVSFGMPWPTPAA